MSKEAPLPETPEAMLHLLHSGNPELSPAGISAALAYLKAPAPARTGEDKEAEYFNLVIAILLAQPLPVEGLPSSLLESAGNAAIPVILRDYSVQHFFHVWARETNPGIKASIEQRLKAEVENPESALRGTALLTACRVFESGKSPVGPKGEKLRSLDSSTAVPGNTRTISYAVDDFAAAALLIAATDGTTPAVRASAFHVLLRLGIRSSLQPARTCLRDGACPEVVRCAALAVVGSFGDLSVDGSLLQSIPARPELVRTAADHATTRLAGTSHR